jgi:hypothetical protein
MEQGSFNTRTAVAAVSAVRSATLMYDVLLQWASAEEEEAVPPSKQAAAAAAGPSQSLSSSSSLSQKVTVPSAAAAASPGPSTAADGKASVSAKTAVAAGTSGSRLQGSSDVLRKVEVVAEDFYRHCAAVALWGPNLGALNELIKIGLMLTYMPIMLGDAESLMSWQTSELNATAKKQDKNFQFEMGGTTFSLSGRGTVSDVMANK